MLNFFGFGGMPQIGNKVANILDDEELDDHEKLRGLLKLDQIAKCQTGNMTTQARLIEFLQKKEVMLQLVKYSVSMPEDPTNEDESYRFPNVAQEILTSTTQVTQSLMEGGYTVKRVMKSPVKEKEAENNQEGSSLAESDEKTQLVEVLDSLQDTVEETQKKATKFSKVSIKPTIGKAREEAGAPQDEPAGEDDEVKLDEPVEVKLDEPVEEDAEEVKLDQEEPSGEQEPAKVSDAFLNLKMSKPSYQEGEEKPKNTRYESTNDEDEFERDDDEEDDYHAGTPLAGQSGEAPTTVINEDSSDDSSQQPEEQVPEYKDVREACGNTALLDMLFSFIGAGNVEDEDHVRRNELNLFRGIEQHVSRSTAGTNENMPGKNEGHENQIGATKEKPELLPVTCGYFFNIVRNLLSKCRKQTVRYILLDTEGRLYDKLAENIQHHSLSTLLVELMTLRTAFNMPQSESTHATSDEEEEKKTWEQPTSEQQQMNKVLEEKKQKTLKHLISLLGPRNTDVEAALNSVGVLTELIDIQTSFELFFKNNTIETIIEMAIDPSNP